MGIGNLITVFGPSIVGHSTPDPEPMQTINETKYQAMVGGLAYFTLNNNRIYQALELLLNSIDIMSLYILGRTLFFHTKVPYSHV